MTRSMPLKFPLGLLLMLASCCLCAFGTSESNVSEGTTAEPQDVDLSQLEAGQRVTNGHVKLGGHVACYFGGLYSYMADKDDKQPAGPDTSLSEYYYPIISEQHPSAQQLIADYGSLEQVPLDVELPEIESFRVLVKTDRFDKLRDLPVEQAARLPSVQGLVVNRVDRLSAEELRLLHTNFPLADFENVLLVEEGRTPSPEWLSSGMIITGIVLSLLGPVLMIWGGIQWIVRLARSAGPQPVLGTVADNVAPPSAGQPHAALQPPFPQQRDSFPPGSER